MADLPEASVTIDDEAGGFAGSTGYAVVLGCVAENDDLTPRVFASAKAFLDQHGYCPAADYIAMHIGETRKPVIFVGLPTASAGTVGRQNSTGVTGSSAITVAAGSDGVLDEVDAILTVVTGGTIGVTGIVLSLSLDGGVTEKSIRLQTATSYTIPYVGIVISFGGGTLVAGDVYTFTSTAPMWDGTGLADARDALGAQLKQARSFVVIGDLPNSTFAGYVTTETNGYETENQRFVYSRVSVFDRLPLAEMAQVTKRMTGSPTITFAEVGGTGDTITRTTGSFITDGFAVGDVITVAGAVASAGANNVTGPIATLTATVITLGSTDIENEGPISGVTITASPGITFAEVGGTADTITRTEGSWLADGFRVGDNVTIAGTSLNDQTTTAGIETLTATVMTFDTDDMDAEVIRADAITITKGQTMAAWVSALDSAFASVDSQKRIDPAMGRGRKLSPITGWSFRRPAMWAFSVREYQHDLQIPTWRKADGPFDGWSLEDEDGNIVEFDERVDGGGLAARFSCFRTYGNGPNGTFGALSLTRAPEGSLLSRTHNLAVANLACTTVQAETENAIGQVLVLKSDGTGTEESLSIIEGRVNSALQMALLQDKGEGPRASSAVWRASRTTVLNTPGAELPGVLSLLLNGTLEKITTTVRVQTNG